MKNNLINLCDSNNRTQYINPAHVVRMFLHGGSTSVGYLVNIELSSGSLVTINFPCTADQFCEDKIIVEVASWLGLEAEA